MVHLIDCDEKPEEETAANCGEKVIFYPIDVDLQDEDICPECLLRHRKGPRKLLTFAVMEE